MAAEPREPGGPGIPAVVSRARVLSGLLLTLAVAWSTPLGEISPDTKTDLYVDPAGFLNRALHLWDPQVTWGVMQNQGYGYLFPMGPFFATVGSVVPMWIAQRLWWSLLLALGYLGMLWLLRELDVKGGWANHLAALAYALSPRVITTLGGLSSESLPTLLAPLVLAPLVAGSKGRLPPRRAAAISGLAVLGCGGVNATATLLVLVPAGVWLISRSRWWRQSLTWWWSFAVVCATAWWAVPLVLLGRYSPPFLDWIENARMVSSPIGLFDAVRGTSHWLGHLLTPDGPWWPAGYQLVSDPWVVLATAVLAGLGLAGLATLTVPHRGVLVALLLIGLVVIAVPHSGPLASPFAAQAQELLDGALSPLRNVHKADPLIRLPLTVALAHLLTRVVVVLPSRTRFWQGSGRLASSVVVATVALSLVWGASPGIDGHLAPRGTFAAIPTSWTDAGDWLSDHAAGQRSLIVPAANFGEYTWGRPLDEPLRPLTDEPYAVRDAVPLTPANTVRFLDAIEQRLQRGRDIEGAVAALARVGVRYLILRNDLDTSASGVPPVMFAGSSIRSTPSVRLVARFGQPTRDLSGVLVSAVEIYELRRPVADAVEVWPASASSAVLGASEAMPALAGLDHRPGPVIFDGDAIAGFDPVERVETDAYRARERFFGVIRGQDASSGLTPSEDRSVSDYRPWEGDRWRSAVTLEGVDSVSASSSIATQHSIVGVRPAYRPYAALDGDATTGWLAFADGRPSLDLTLDRAMSPSGLRISPFADDRSLGRGLGVVTRVRVVTDAGSVTHDLDPRGGSQPVPGVGTRTRQIRIEIVDTTRGAPGETLTGLAEVTLPGMAVRERVVLGPVGPGLTQSVVLGVGSEGAGDGCLRAEEVYRCVSGQFRPAEETTAMHRALAVSGPGEFALSGTLVANPLKPFNQLLVAAEIEETTSSSVRAVGAAGAPSAAFDLDARTAWSPAPGDRAPTLSATFVEPVTVGEIRLRTRDRWTSRHTAVVRVDVDGQERFGRIAADGHLAFPPMTGRSISITLVREASDEDPLASLEVEEVGLVGVQRSKPETDIAAACGDGPVLSVNDVPFATRVSGTREAALGFGTMTWTACSPIGLGYLPVDTVDIASWEGMSPDSTVVTRVDGPGQEGSAVTHGQPQAVADLVRLSPTGLAGQIPDGPRRLLVMTDNANRGWVAKVGDVELAPMTVDGFRQAFVLPEGVQGALSIRFAPDSTYRLALGTGLLLALLLIPLALGSSGRSASPPARWRGPRLAAPFGAVLLSAVIAGLWGALAVVPIVLALRMPAVRRRRVEMVAILALSSGVVEGLAGSSGLSAQVLEVTTRLLVLLAIAVVVATPSGTPVARDSDS